MMITTLALLLVGNPSERFRNNAVLVLDPNGKWTPDSPIDEMEVGTLPAIGEGEMPANGILLSDVKVSANGVVLIGVTEIPEPVLAAFQQKVGEFNQIEGNHEGFHFETGSNEGRQSYLLTRSKVYNLGEGAVEYVETSDGEFDVQALATEGGVVKAKFEEDGSVSWNAVAESPEDQVNDIRTLPFSAATLFATDNGVQHNGALIPGSEGIPFASFMPFGKGEIYVRAKDGTVYKLNGIYGDSPTIQKLDHAPTDAETTILPAPGLGNDALVAIRHQSGRMTSEQLQATPTA